ncbi:Virulence factors putative positive transcription regulator BvgA [compost metagenome]
MMVQEEITTIIIDDHPLMVAATTALLQELGGIHLVGVASGGLQGLQMIEEMKPRLVILEWCVKDADGTEIVKQIKEVSPETKILVFTGANLNELYPELVQSEAHGVVSKEAGHDTLKHLIFGILDGYRVFPDIPEEQKLTFQSQEDILLSEDEARIMNLILSGYTLVQIAEAMSYSKRSIDNYLHRLYKKMGVTSRTQALELFVRTKYYKK